MKKYALIIIGLALLLACQCNGDILYRATFGYLSSNNPPSPEPEDVEYSSIENWNIYISMPGLIQSKYENDDAFQTQSHGRYSLYLKDPDSTTNYAKATSPIFINNANEYMIEFWFYVPGNGVAFNEGFPILTPLNANGADTNGTDLKLTIIPSKTTPAYMDVFASNMSECALVGRLDSTDQWYKLQLHRRGDSVDVYLMSELKTTLAAASSLKANMLRIGAASVDVQGEAYWDDFIVTTVPQGVHPRLFVDSAGVEALRQRAQSNTMTVLGKSYRQIFYEDIGDQAIWWAEDPFLNNNAGYTLHDVKWVYPFYQPPRRSSSGYPAWTEAGQDSFPERIEDMAIAAVVLDSQKYYDYLKPILKAFGTWQQWTDPDFRHPYYMYACLDEGHFTQSIALAYDLLFNHLSNYEKMNVQNAIITLGLQHLNYQFFLPERGEGADFWAVTRSGLGIGSLVIDPPCMSYLNNSKETVENKLICNPYNMDPNRQTAQSTVYGYYTAAMTTKWVEAVTRASVGYPDYYDYPFYSNYADSRPKWHPVRGNKAYQPIFTQDYGRDMLGNDPSSVYLIASRKNNEYAQFIASKWPWPSTCEFVPWCRFVWFDASVDTVRPDESLGRGINFQDVGCTSMRTDWTDDGFTVFLKSGVRASGHDHKDKNSFVLLGRNGWLLKDYSTWGGETNRHSTILIDGEGQAGFYQFPGSYLKRGYIEKYFSDFHYSYSAGRAESLYVYFESPYNNKLDLYRRELLIDNDNKILLLNDNIKRAESTNHTIDWLLAVPNVSIHSDSAAIYLEDDTLWCRMLSPQNSPLQHIQEINPLYTPDTVFNCINVEPNPLDTPVASAKYLAVFFRHDPLNPNRSIVAVSGHKINGVTTGNTYLLYADSLDQMESAYYVTNAMDTVVNVMAGLLTNHEYRIVIQDTISKHAMAIFDTTTTGGGTIRFVFNANGKPCKVFITTDYALPMGTIGTDENNIGFKYTKLNTTASYPYALVDDMFITQKHWVNNDTLPGFGYWVEDSTGWIPYGQEGIYLLALSQQDHPNVFTVKYRVLGTLCSQIYESPMYFNDIKPSYGTIAVNNSDSFANSCTVQVKVGGSDAFPGLWKMRFNEAPFGIQSGYRNIVGNGTFESLAGWAALRATVQDGYARLWGREAADTTVVTAWLKKIVLAATVDTFRGKLLRITNDIYAQNVTKAKRYIEVFYSDTLNPSSAIFGLKNISTGAGGYWRSQSDTFTLNIGSRPVSNMIICYQVYGGINTPPPDSNQYDYTISLDNVRLEPVAIEPVTEQIIDYWSQADTQQVYNYQVSSGDGLKRIYLQLQDSSHNISSEPGWYDEIILDRTKPISDITSPTSGSNVSGTVSVRANSSDANYQGWTLECRPVGGSEWTYLSSGTNQLNHKFVFYYWNTNNFSDGQYYLRLTAVDKAENVKADTHQVRICNEGLPPEEIESNLVTFDCLPVDAATDAQGCLYITDTQDNKIWKYSPQGDSIFCFGYRSNGQDTIGFSQPVGIFVDDSDAIWVADCYNAKIKKFSQNGEMLLSFGDHGNGPGEFNQPTGLFVDNGFIYITDKMNNRVQKFNYYGSYINHFGDSILFQPSGIAIAWDYTDSLPVKYIYISDTKHNRVARFTLEGILYDTLAFGIGLNQAWDICFDDIGNLFIADVLNNRIVAVDPYGSPYLSFGVQGSGPGEFNKPQGLAFSPDGRYLYVVDTHNNRIQRFEVKVTSWGGGSMSSGRINLPANLPSVYTMSASYPNPLHSVSTIDFALPRSGPVKLSVYNITGQKVKSLVDGTLEAGYHAIRWDGRDNCGVKSANGVYFVKMSADGFNALKKLVILR